MTPCHNCCSAVQLPDELTFTQELPLEWLRTEMYTKAHRLLERHRDPTKKTPQYRKVSDDEYLVLTNEGVSKYKKITDKMVNRFELCYQGSMPRGFKKFDQVAEICGALVKVQTSTVPGSSIPCKANPFDFLCGCKGARKTGICSHILLVTHEEMKNTPQERRKAICNLNFMVGEIAGASKGTGRPKTVRHCLVREDSDDDDDDVNVPTALTW